MARKGEHKKTKPGTKDSCLYPMGRWRRKNIKKYQSCRKKYKQTSKSNSRNKARRVLMKSGRNKVCVKCKTRPESRRLEVHHKDGNSLNNTLSNLEWRCSKCNPRGRGAGKK